MRDKGVPAHLSDREQQLIKYAAEGLIDSAIADKLGISVATVGTYWGRIRIKIGPYSRTELVAMVIRMEAEATMQQLKEDNHRLSEQLQSRMAAGGSSDLFLELLKSTPEAVFIVSQRATIEFANPSACELFGFSIDEFLGQHISMLVPERLRRLHEEHVDDYFWKPTKRKMGEHLDTLALRKDGGEFPIAATLSTATVDHEEHAICLVRDVTTEKLVFRLASPDSEPIQGAVIPSHDVKPST